MVSPLVLTPMVLLHAAHGADVTVAAYLLRVVFFVIALAGLGVLGFWSVRVAGVVRSEITGRR